MLKSRLSKIDDVNESKEMSQQAFESFKNKSMTRIKSYNTVLHKNQEPDRTDEASQGTSEDLKQANYKEMLERSFKQGTLTTYLTYLYRK